MKEEQENSRRRARLLAVSDRVLGKLERAVEELDVQLVRRVTKVKQIEYNNEQRPDKPTKETVVEDEEVSRQQMTVDRAGLKQITSALRDLKEVQMLRAPMDVREQEAKIARLEQQIAEAEKVESFEVVLGEAEELAE